jgi:hypothetical protein
MRHQADGRRQEQAGSEPFSICHWSFPIFHLPLHLSPLVLFCLGLGEKMENGK